ncbi:PHP domain-containing protein [Anaerosporobacter sp.]|uniref:PHP domain-containing protein n=1 Tax=Anaerosporobacter sp. TaxID=1872529 RepID=UPI00286F3B55|nr:PHP domain-containing protein [Anaerosporobacter sp.]
MKQVLEYYDIFPKVLLINHETTITIIPLGSHAAFTDSEEYSIMPVPMYERIDYYDGEYPRFKVKPENGLLQFNVCFSMEQPVQLVIFNSSGERVEVFKIYTLESDLYELTPYMGDLHVHTNRSDGKESPAFVAAYYRKAGFDFMTITDHAQYAPSLEAIECYKDAPIDLKIFPGEEIHMPGSVPHIVNFGGEASVNDYFNKDLDNFYKEIEELKQQLEIPEGIPINEYVRSVWAFQKIKEYHGLAIYPHPHWIDQYAYHNNYRLLCHLFETKPFDAFELIGGQTLEENQMQTAFYSEMKEKGHTVPVVGNSDSHGVIESEWFEIGKTVVLSKSNEKADIINAIKEFKSVALEKYNHEKKVRIYGPYRLVNYVDFLLQEYFPIHDDLCYEEGRLMKEYVNQKPETAKALASHQGATAKLIDKYFGRG